MNGLKKLELAKQMASLLKKLKSDDLKGLEKLEIARSFQKVRSQLLSTDTKTTKNLWEKLLSGDLDSLKPTKFMEAVKDIVNDNLASIDDVKEPMMRYINNNKDVIRESPA